MNALAAAGAVIAERTPTSLSTFLASVPGSWEMQLFYGLMISGTIGMLAHYAVKWARDEIKGGLFAYFKNNIKTTVLSLFSYIGVAIGAIASGAFTGEYGGFVGWKMVFWMGITNGFTIDALVNKTARASWTLPERAEKVAAKTGGIP